jgi:hypothetical protein
MRAVGALNCETKTPLDLALAAPDAERKPWRSGCSVAPREVRPGADEPS